MPDPLYSKEKIRKAGDHLRYDPLHQENLWIAEHWRSAHQAPQNDMRQKLKKLAPKDAFVVSRLQRMESIIGG